MKILALNYKIITALAFLFLTVKVNAQQLNMDVREVDGNIRVYDPADISAKKNAILGYADIEGSAFWDDQWNPAIVYFNNGSKAKINKAKLNLYTNEIHYLNNEGTELSLENEGVIRLVFLNQHNLTQPIASFAKLVNHLTGNGTGFYKILNAGFYQLLLVQKQLIKISPYDPIQGKRVSSFYAKKNYAIYNEGKIIALNDLNKKELLSVLPNDTSMELLMKDNKSKMKTEKEVIDFLNTYNLTQGKK